MIVRLKENILEQFAPWSRANVDKILVHVDYDTQLIKASKNDTPLTIDIATQRLSKILMIVR